MPRSQAPGSHSADLDRETKRLEKGVLLVFFSGDCGILAANLDCQPKRSDANKGYRLSSHAHQAKITSQAAPTGCDKGCDKGCDERATGERSVRLARYECVLRPRLQLSGIWTAYW